MLKKHTYVLSTIFFICALFFFPCTYTGTSAVAAQDTPELGDVMFDSDEEGFSESAQKVLNKNIEVLYNNPSYKVRLEGYSDVTGNDEYNREISLKRALKVSEYLIRSGIDRGRIESVGMGETDKFGAGETNEALGKNRRVIFVLEYDETRAPPEPVREAEAESPEIAGKVPDSAPGEGDTGPGEQGVTNEPAGGVSDNGDTGAEDENPPPLPGEIADAIEKGVIKLAPGEILFETPLEMRTGKTYLLQVEVPNSFVDELTESLQKNSLAVNGVTMSKDVIIRLTGEKFEFEPVEESPGGADDAADESGFISESLSEYTNWQWLVRPTESGYQTVTASVIVNIEKPRFSEDDVRAETFQKVIYVKPGIIESVMKSYLVLTILGVLLLSFISWVVFRKYNAGKAA